MKRVLVLGMCFGMLAGIIGCKDAVKKAKKQVKVDCEQLCSHTFKQCVTEVLLASGKLDAKKIDMITKAGALGKVKEAGYNACMTKCKEKKGYGSDAGKVNKCLEKKDCKAYAACIKDVM
ncbi:MAG: hypothetical protein ABI333_20590 [bacterium]